MVSIDGKKFLKNTEEPIKIGPSESMSKSKKNTIDQEKIIKEYGADSVRLFILSDSPPEKDVQWSDKGVTAANKFLQKIWNLVILIVKRKNITSEKKKEEELNNYIANISYKIDKTISSFKFNVTIAHFYEAYKVILKFTDLKVDNETLVKNMIQILKLMLPLTPHIANETLELLKCKETNIWPHINKDFTAVISIAVQINGKTRIILDVAKDLTQKEIEIKLRNNEKIQKYLYEKKVLKIIFIKNKIINYIIK